MTLTPADIRTEWPRIEGQMAAACGTGYPAVEVYHACRRGSAVLYLCPEGWVVLEGYTREDTGEREVIVLAAYALGEANLLDQYSGEMEEIARNYGAKTLAFRRLKDAPWTVKGWRMRAAEYEKEL